MKHAAQYFALTIAVTAAGANVARADDNFMIGIGVGALGRLIDDPSKRACGQTSGHAANGGIWLRSEHGVFADRL